MNPETIEMVKEMQAMFTELREMPVKSSVDIKANAKLFIADLPDMYAAMTDFSGGVIDAAKEALEYIQPALEAQALQLSLETSVGVKGAAELMDNLQDISAKSVYGGGVVKEQGVALSEAGFSGSEVASSVQMLGTAAGGNQADFAKLTSTFAEVRESGALTLKTLQAFESAGFSPLQQMADDTGVSVATFYERLAQGSISFADVQTALQNATAAGGGFQQEIDRLNNSEFGKLQIMNNELDGIREKLGEFLIPLFGFFTDYLIKPLIDSMYQLSIWLEENKQAFYALSFGLLAAAAAYGLFIFWEKQEIIVGALVEGVLTAIAVAQELWSLAMTLNPIGAMIALVVGLVAAIVYAWENIEGFRKFLWSLWEVFRQVFTNIGNFFAEIFSPITDAIAAIQEGRYLDAVKSVGTLAVNLNPIGFQAKAMGFIYGEDGLTKDVGKAYDEGGAKFELSKPPEPPEKSAAQPTTPSVTDYYTSMFSSKKATTATSAVDTTTRDITAGGSKTINISTVKFTDRIEVHNATAQESAGELQRIFEDMFLRVLNINPQAS